MLSNNQMENKPEVSSTEQAFSYWTHYMKEGGASIETMMLDSNAALLDPEDRGEMLSLLPEKLGACLELGAGVGRFTRDLAAKAKSVVAVDFMESAIIENRHVNGAAGNIEFMTEDVTLLELNAQFDVVFSNWLLMYLSDEAVVQLFSKIVRWLPEGGLFVFRESCFHSSGLRYIMYHRVI